MIDILGEKKTFPKMGKCDFLRESKNDFDRIPGFPKILQGEADVNKVNIWKASEKSDPSETHFTVGNLIFLEKGDAEIKRGRTYQLKFPSVDRGEKNRDRNTLRGKY